MSVIQGAMTDFGGSVLYYWGQLRAGVWMKAVVAAIATFFTEVLFGDVVVMNIYFALAALDLVLGITRAKLTGTYQSRFLLFWVRKMISYGVITVAIGLVCQQLFRLANVTIYAVNWSLFICSITELTSIVNNLRKLGLPIPGHIDEWIDAWRRKASAVFSSGLESNSNDFSFKEVQVTDDTVVTEEVHITEKPRAKD